MNQKHMSKLSEGRPMSGAKYLLKFCCFNPLTMKNEQKNLSTFLKNAVERYNIPRATRFHEK